jgi:hypothetical protein
MEQKLDLCKNGQHNETMLEVRTKHITPCETPEFCVTLVWEEHPYETLFEGYY